ncbi:MAG: hypothetical protein M0Q23_09340 [Syntrophales bacterium]|nr:hypothetical protein [Syntrophales bacterium]MCK9528821.1 hypothetical protein [Syntrophales bacterium]MDX9921979.1 hypothetical protein [Syntrophales bacterium]
MKKALITIILVVVIVAGGTLATVYVMLDKIIHKAIEVVGPEITGVSVEVNSVSIAPFSGAIELKSLTLGTPQGFNANRSLFVRDITVRISMASLLKKVIVIEEVIVDGASITWEGVLGNNHRQIIRNMQTYVEGFTQPAAGGKPPGPDRKKETGRNVTIKKVVLRNSSLVLVAAGKQLATVPIPNRRLTDISTGKGGKRPEEAVRETYDLVYDTLSRSAGEHSRVFREKLGELEQRGKDILESAGEATAGIREEAAEKLRDIKQGLKNLFK